MGGRLRAWLVWWGAVVAVGLVLGASPAVAEPLPSSGLVRLLPAGRLVGDGVTPATVHLLALGPDGRPLTALKLKATAEGGRAGEPVELGDGLYAVEIVPSAVADEEVFTLTVRGRSGLIGAVDVSRRFPVAPPSTGRIQIAANPPSLVLGQDAEATLRLVVDLPPAQLPDPEDLVVRVSSGEVTEIVAMGDGSYVARYLAPSVNYPHLALLTVVDRRDPGAVFGAFTLPLSGKVDYPVTATEGATVVLEVADRTFGPVTAGAGGRATVPIVVPPGNGRAAQVTRDGGETTRTDLDLRVPESRRLHFLPLPTTLPSDSRVTVPVRLLVREAAGAPDPSAAVNLTATVGRVTRPTHLGDGVYEATFTPPDSRTPVEATLQVSVPGSTVQSDAVELTLVPAMPATLDVTATPDALPAGGTALELIARLEAADGSGLPGRELRLDLDGASLSGAVRDVGGGDYEASLRADPATSVRARLLALPPVSSNPLRRLVIIPSREQVSADGQATMPVTVVTADAFGYPVPGVAVDLTVEDGGGRLPASVTTDEAGTASVVFTAGASPALVTLRATARGALAEAALVQADGVDVPALPRSGTPDQRAAEELWAQSVRTLWVPREGGVEPTADVPMATGDLAAIALSAEPAVVAPGGAVTLVVTATDARGNPVGDVDLEFFATAGARVLSPKPRGGGRYEARLEVPDDARGVVKVNVMGNGGAANGVLEVRIAGDAGGDLWGASAAPADAGPAPDDAAPPPPPEPTPVARLPEIDRPFLRMRLSFLASSYSYVQDPEADPGGLLPERLAWGGEVGGAAAPLGGEFNVRAHLPTVPYLAFQGNLRISAYSVASDAFEEPARDTLYAAKVDVIGRAPIAIGRDELSFGARVGFRYDDFITFRQCDQPDCAAAFEPLGIPGLDVGLEVGAEFWKMYLLAAASGGFAYGSQPYAIQADANLGWNFTKNVFADVGFGWQRREAFLESAETGDRRGSLADQQFLGTVGVGASF